MGRKTLLSKLHMLPNYKRQPGRRVLSPGLLLVGFLVERGRIAFFYCTLKEQSLEPPLRYACTVSAGVGRGGPYGGEEGCNHAAGCSARKGKGTVVLR